MLSADVPSGIRSLTLAPCSNRNVTVSYRLLRTAKSSGV